LIGIILKIFNQWYQQQKFLYEVQRNSQKVTTKAYVGTYRFL